MKTLFYKIKKQSPELYHCGLIHAGLALLLILLMLLDNRQLLGISLWVKPIKFALSIAIYSLTWPLLLQYFPDGRLKRRFVRFTVFVLSFEMAAIASQAARGELSHFNQSGIYNITLYVLMGLAITAQTIFSLYIGIRFFKTKPAGISPAMLWAIRLAILTAGIFALEGGLMGNRMAHTVGAADGGSGIPILNWSKSHGDLRIAHFFGLHALQLIPLIVLCFNLKKVTPVVIFSLIYFALVSFLFFRALMGIPL